MAQSIRAHVNIGRKKATTIEVNSIPGGSSNARRVKWNGDSSSLFVGDKHQSNCDHLLYGGFYGLGNINQSTIQVEKSNPGEEEQSAQHEQSAKGKQ